MTQNSLLALCINFQLNLFVVFSKKSCGKYSLENQVFLWLMIKKFIAVEDNLLKREWKHGKMCVYCGNDESIDHLIFQCSAARLIWSLLKCTFDLQSAPTTLFDCFGRWIKDFPKDDRRLCHYCNVLGNLEMQKQYYF
jgi:hypothetical protein